jgi:hypothetical protein
MLCKTNIKFVIQFKMYSFIILSLLKGYKHTLVRDFWTSGTDKDCDGKFRWCSKNEDFRNKEIAWHLGEPSNTGDCVYLKNGNTSKETFLATDSCSANKSFICEV